MKKTLVAALAVAGIGLQSWAQVTWPSALHVTYAPSVAGNRGIVTDVPTTKLGLLSISLKNDFQAYSKTVSGKLHWGIEVSPNDPRVMNGTVTWDNISYTYSDAVDCSGKITYRSNTRQINNATIIGAINKALSWPVGKNSAGQSDPNILGGPLVASASPYRGSFSTTTAKLVVVNYDNGRMMPPYPPTEDYVGDETTTFDSAVYNAPFWLEGLPTQWSGIDGEIMTLNWPNQNYIAWGKVWYDGETSIEAGKQNAGYNWVGARVFIIDTKNANANLRCFDVTPFFELSESYCYYCWDTMDRVTDGTVTFGSSSSFPPCAGGTSSCGITGSGTTKFYWTVKFNNVQRGWGDDVNAPNTVLSGTSGSSGIGVGQWSLYYNQICGLDSTYGDTFGWKLDDTDEPGSQYALSFTVNGIATYPWKYKVLSDSATWPVGTMSMTASGHGFSPMCGLFSGSVKLVEYDKTAKDFGGNWCVAP